MDDTRYRCIGEFSVPLCDSDGYPVESGEMVPVEVGETFYRSGGTWMNDVRLECVGDTYGWLEIDSRTFEENFEVVKGEE